MSSFQCVGIEGSTVYRGVLISGCWNGGIPLYTEVSSFQCVGMEEFHCTEGVLISVYWNRGFHCIQRCPHFRVLEWRNSTVYRGVLISVCWNGGVPLYTEVSSFQCVGMEEFHCIQQRCPHLRVRGREGGAIEGFHVAVLV